MLVCLSSDCGLFWGLSFPAPRVWECFRFMMIVSLVFVWPLPGCGLLILVCVVLSGGFCFGLMPLSYVFREGAVRFSFFWGAFGFMVCSWLFVGLFPFGNKFLLIQKKQKKRFIHVNTSLKHVLT